MRIFKTVETRVHFFQSFGTLSLLCHHIYSNLQELVIFKRNETKKKKENQMEDLDILCLQPCSKDPGFLVSSPTTSWVSRHGGKLLKLYGPFDFSCRFWTRHFGLRLSRMTLHPRVTPHPPHLPFPLLTPTPRLQWSGTKGSFTHTQSPPLTYTWNEKWQSCWVRSGCNGQ